MTEEELVEKLKGLEPRVNKGRVTLWRDSGTEEEQDVTAEFPGAELYLDEHPEGVDRGGYCPYVEYGGLKAVFGCVEGEWTTE